MSKISDLSNFEKRVLSVLDKDSSMPLNKIAKILNTSPQRVDYVIKKLVKSEIIKEFITIIDYKKLGYNVGFVYYKLKLMPPEKYESMIEYLYSSEDVLVVLEAIGEFDIAIGFFFKNLYDLNDKILKFKRMFSEFLYKDTTSVHIGAKRSYRDYLVSSDSINKIPEIMTGGNVSEVRYKRLDLEILSIISRNSRENISNISKKLNSNPYTIKRRLEYLKEKGVILGSTIILNLKNYNYHYYRLLLRIKTYDEKVEKEIFNYLVSHPNVIQAVKNFGDYSITVDLEIKDVFKLRDFTSLLVKNFGNVIENYDVIRVYNILKFRYFPSELLKSLNNF